MTLLAVLLVAAVTPVRAAAGGGAPAAPWRLQSGPTGANLLDVSCASPRECVAVGGGATIIRTTDGGSTWRLVPTGYGRSHPTARFTSVRCPAPGVCSVLAPPNTILRTVNGGRSWASHTVTLWSQLGALTHLACPTRAVCYVTASPSGNPFSWFDHSGTVFKTGNGGSSWMQLTVPAYVTCPGDCNSRPVGFELQWISCQNALHCRAGGTTFIGSHEGYAAAVIRTNNGGTNWVLATQLSAPTSASCPTVSICTGIYYAPTTPNRGPDIMRSTDAGTIWALKPIGPALTAVACTGQTFCALAGPGGALATAMGTRVVREGSPTTRTLAAVACPRARVCYAVGAHGTIVARKG